MSDDFPAYVTRVIAGGFVSFNGVAIPFTEARLTEAATRGERLVLNMPRQFRSTITAEFKWVSREFLALMFGYDRPLWHQPQRTTFVMAQRRKAARRFRNTPRRLAQLKGHRR